ncbi:MAG: hypothetical protein WCO44_04780 [Bacteroidota bacterium]
MFNSPLLDVTIGLVFIFLLYSLLATTIHEILATLLKLRSRMLKRAIIEGMLSDTPTDSIWASIRSGITNFFNRFRTSEQEVKAEYKTLLNWVLSLPVIRNIAAFIKGNGNRPVKSGLGYQFFDHPLIKNYGSSRIFPLPSYIPTKNFSTVLIDVLKQDFVVKTREIAVSKLPADATDEQIMAVMQTLGAGTDISKITELLDFYGRHYATVTPAKALVEKDTLQILQMHLTNSVNNLEIFSNKIEGWYDDTMDRVSGWYKRQSQFILLSIGLCLAVMFNVDVIKVADRLSVDKDARDKLVQMAIQASDKYKDDPRVKNLMTDNGIKAKDTLTVNNLFNEYQAKADSAKKMLDGDVKASNEILAVGWGDYGIDRFKARVLARHQIFVPNKFWKTHKSAKLDSCLNLAFIVLCKEHWIRYNSTVHNVCYVLNESAHWNKILGFLLLAFAVSLGAPFWFDMLNKVIKLRSSGVKQDSATTPSPGNAAKATTASVNVNAQDTGGQAGG